MREAERERQGEDILREGRERLREQPERVRERDEERLEREIESETEKYGETERETG